MAASFKQTAALSTPRVGRKQTPDAAYWNNFEFPVTVKEYGAVSCVDFSPVEPYSFAVTASDRVQIYNSRTNKVEKVLTRFKEAARSGRFRSDGELLVAGGDEGLVRVFHLDTKTSLRTFTGHTRSVHAACFSSDKVHVLSASDDKTTRLWDLATGEAVQTLTGHQDYVRSLAVCKSSADMWITGNMFLSAGRNCVKVWDALGGGRLLATCTNHHKTVTSLAFNSTCSRLLSASLDRHVKVYDVGTYQCVASLTYPSPILSFGVSPSEDVMAVGCADGMLSIQRRKQEDSSAKQALRQRKRRGATSRRFYGRGGDYRPVVADYSVTHKQKEQLKKFDKHLKTFSSTKALDEALKPCYPAEVTVGVIQELIRRGSIKEALAGRDDKGLELLLTFLCRWTCEEKYCRVLLDVTTLVVDMYAAVVGQSGKVDRLLQKLLRSVQRETSHQEQLLNTLGSLGTLLATAQGTNTS
ncbi:UTP15 [Branchiostoma lanceolatum]|uniref:U3 small nucleolar RNA-associated protein 15 homolog n=1 Tax=Branchiostoma lanceolatum TaxID=7740 RepID=A0A8K0E645_BRALA|nr:UTP15 [Branchiostoma lanceolatum]